MQAPETVRIASDAPDTGGYIVINKDDLKPEHKLFEEPEAKPDPKPASEKKPAKSAE